MARLFPTCAIPRWIRLGALALGCFASAPASSQQAADADLDIGALMLQAKAGDANAQNLVGALYQTGSGVGRNLAEAAHWYSMAVEQGHPAAQVNLGALYIERKVAEPIRGRGVELVKMAAGRGDPLGMARLGAIYLKEHDVERGNRLLMHAVDLRIGLAAYELGRAHQFGIGLPQDSAKAKAWYLRSSDLGYPPGQYVRARHYETDPKIAFLLYQRAAVGGHALSQYELGRIYENPGSAYFDRAKAAHWYTKAAMNGNEMGNQARFRLGLPDIRGNPPVNKKVLTTSHNVVPLDDHTTVVAMAAAVGIALVILTAGNENRPGSGANSGTKRYCLPCNDWLEMEWPDTSVGIVKRGPRRPVSAISHLEGRPAQIPSRPLFYASLASRFARQVARLSGQA